jgi:hypothetical protein
MKTKFQKNSSGNKGERGRNIGNFNLGFLRGRDGAPEQSDVNLNLEDFTALTFDSETHVLLDIEKIDIKVCEKTFLNNFKQIDDQVLLLFSLYSETQKKEVSECYEVILGSNQPLPKKVSCLFRVCFSILTLF